MSRHPESDPNLHFGELSNFDNLEKIRIETFAEVIPKLLIEAQPVEIDELKQNPKNDAREKFLNTRKRTGDPIAYLSPEIAELYDGSVLFEPYRSQGGKASRHGVIFGDLSFGQDKTIPIAVKPFEIVEGRVEAEKECLNDYFGNAAAYKLGVGGLRPVGIVDDASKNLYSLTVLQKSLDTFDNIDWSGFLPNIELNPGMEELWLRAAHSIAILHSLGDSYHGDLFLRNLATNPEGQVFPIDWEYGDFCCLFADDLETRFTNRFRDLKNLIKGMSTPPNIGIESGAGIFMNIESSWWQAFSQIFYTEYRAWRMELASQGNHHMKIVKSTEEELSQLDTDLENEINFLQNIYMKR